MIVTFNVNGRLMIISTITILTGIITMVRRQVMTIKAKNSNKNFSAAEDALGDVSKLLSKMATSRKANSKLADILNLTREVARLSRALKSLENGDVKENDGYGDPSHFAKMDFDHKSVRGVIR
ncbi:MAG TPA: hypothetical protein V6D19_10865 [Stenomitos sp.]